jgi:hypothetical protein
VCTLQAGRNVRRAPNIAFATHEDVQVPRLAGEVLSGRPYVRRYVSDATVAAYVDAVGRRVKLEESA